MIDKKRQQRKPSKDKFPVQYGKHFNSIARLLKRHKNKQFVGYVFNLLEGVTSVERRSRELQRDFNLTFRLIDEIKDANAELYKDLPDETFNKVTDLFAELNYLVSQRLSAAQLALYHNREIPNTRLKAIPLRNPKRQTKMKRKSAAKKGAKRDR